MEEKIAILVVDDEPDIRRICRILLENGGYLTSDEMPGARSVLSAAALTYVASALMAVLQLLRLIAIAGNRRRRD